MPVYRAENVSLEEEWPRYGNRTSMTREVVGLHLNSSKYSHARVGKYWDLAKYTLR